MQTKQQLQNTPQEREKRAAEALRENLRRRRAQAQAKAVKRDQEQ